MEDVDRHSRVVNTGHIKEIIDRGLGKTKPSGNSEPGYGFIQSETGIRSANFYGGSIITKKDYEKRLNAEAKKEERKKR